MEAIAITVNVLKYSYADSHSKHMWLLCLMSYVKLLRMVVACRSVAYGGRTMCWEQTVMLPVNIGQPPLSWENKELSFYVTAVVRILCA